MSSRRRSPPHHRHDGTSPLPLGMDASPAPEKWQGATTVWPHDPRSGWSYCVTIPSWTIIPEAKTAEGKLINPTVFYRVHVGIQSPLGVSFMRGILRRFSDFMKLYESLKANFTRKRIPPSPSKNSLLRTTTSRYFIEEVRFVASIRFHQLVTCSESFSQRRQSLQEWIGRLLEDIEISRSAAIASFFELEAAASSAAISIEDGNTGVSVPMQDAQSQLSYIAGPSSSMASLPSISLDYVSDAACSTSGLRTPTSVSEIEEEMIDSRVAKGKGIDHVVTSRQSASVLQDNGVGLRKKASVDSMSDVGSLTDSSLMFATGVERRLSGAPSVDNMESVLKGVAASLPMDQRGNVKRVLAALQRRFDIAKADMEDLITRLQQEVAVKEFLTTKVRDLEGELDNTRRRSQDMLRQAVSTERERVTELQWELEECRAALMNAEEALQTEKDTKAMGDSRSETLEMELDSLRQQIVGLEKKVETLQKERDAIEAQARGDKRVLAKEVKALRKAQPALQQELDAANQAKAELEARIEEEEVKQAKTEASRAGLVHEVCGLRQRLQECSVDFLAKEDGKLGSIATDAMELLATSDDRITALLAEARLMAQDEDVRADGYHANGKVSAEGREATLRKLLVDILVDNAQLRKAMNSLTRSALVSVQEVEEPAARKTVLNRFL